MIKKDYTREELKAKTYFELRDIAKKKNVENVSYMSEENLIESILTANSKSAQEQIADLGNAPAQEPTAVGGYTREDFQNMTIHSVRTIVREVGITPSTKNKEQLIEAYLELMQSGGVKEGKPAQPKTKRGRPAKSEVPNIVKD
ncbi:MAG: Rho termination factor N-terminal domain-containing protein, partial [Clostridia bacterium]|nr:Rho termination factor N-terminal domain-containing protein [Clostridia bacterium]